MIRYTALLLGIVILCLGVLGLAAPQTLFNAVAFFQIANRAYLAAVIRIVTGGIIYFAAPDSRLPKTLRFAGVVIAVLGVLTPVIRHPLPSLLFGWQSIAYVRPWAAAAIVLGLVILAAVVPPRQHSED